MLPKSFWPYIADVIGAGSKDIATACIDNDNLDNDSSSSSGVLANNGDMEKYLCQCPGDADPIAAEHIKDEYEDNPALSLCGIVPGYDGTFLMLQHWELHHVHSKIIENMTESGTHLSDPREFVE